MTVYIVVREDQSELGYIDASITGVFCERTAAVAFERVERQRVASQGMVIEDANTSDADWQVSWRIEQHEAL